MKKTNFDQKGPKIVSPRAIIVIAHPGAHYLRTFLVKGRRGGGVGGGSGGPLQWVGVKTVDGPKDWSGPTVQRIGVKTVGPLQWIRVKTVGGPKDWSGPTLQSVGVCKKEKL